MWVQRAGDAMGSVGLCGRGPECPQLMRRSLGGRQQGSAVANMELRG